MKHNVLVFIQIGTNRVVRRVQVDEVDKEIVYLVLIEHDVELHVVYLDGNSFEIIADPEWHFYMSLQLGDAKEIWR